jgi:hypothetical protein
MRASPGRLTAEAYGIALEMAAREPRPTWPWAASFGVGGALTRKGNPSLNRLPALAFNEVYAAMREDGFLPDTACVRQGLNSRAYGLPNEARRPPGPWPIWRWLCSGLGPGAWAVVLRQAMPSTVPFRALLFARHPYLSAVRHASQQH